MILLDLPYTRDYFRSLFENAGFAPNIVRRTPYPQMARSMVASGMGLFNSQCATALASLL